MANMRNMKQTAREDVEIYMGQTYILTGIILNTMPVGEYDKRITILTRERGKITAFARGARRPKSSLQAATNLFCFGSFEAYEGRSSYTVVKAEISNYFRELATDLDKTYYGCYFLELADYFCQENSDCVNQLKLVYQTLRALNVPSLSPKLVRVIYELKTLVYFGVYPNVFACTACGSRENLWCFDEKSNGVMCRDCQPGSAKYPLDDAALYTMQYIVTAPVEKLYTFTVTEEVFDQVRKLIQYYINQYVEKELKTVAFLT